MRIHDQVINILSQYNQGVASSTAQGEATAILVLYPLLFVSLVGLFFGAIHMALHRPENRTIVGFLFAFITTAFLTALVVYFVWMQCSCDGYAIWLRPSTSGRLCGARGGDAVSLVPLFDGRVKPNEAEKFDRITEVVRVIDALISLSVEASVVNMTMQAASCA